MSAFFVLYMNTDGKDNKLSAASKIENTFSVCTISFSQRPTSGPHKLMNGHISTISIRVNQHHIQLNVEKNIWQI